MLKFIAVDEKLKCFTVEPTSMMQVEHTPLTDAQAAILRFLFFQSDTSVRCYCVASGYYWVTMGIVYVCINMQSMFNYSY